jgi:hypothetical protein
MRNWGFYLANRECKFLGLKREIRRRFPYRSYGKASISAGLLALFGGSWWFVFR